MAVGCYLNSFQNSAPTLRCRPDLVHGIPVARDTRRFALVTPNWRLQLHPPLFIGATPSRGSQSDANTDFRGSDRYLLRRGVTLVTWAVRRRLLNETGSHGDRASCSSFP